MNLRNITAAVVLVAALIFLGFIGSALSGIFHVPLNRHAVGGDSSRFFPQDTLAGAFRER